MFIIAEQLLPDASSAQTTFEIRLHRHWW